MVEKGQMNVAGAEAAMHEIAALRSEARIEVGVDGNAPHDFAYITLYSDSDPEQFAVVSSPGSRWFEIKVNGGFYTGRADDMADDAEVREYIEEYVEAATAYLAGRWSRRKSWLFHLPIIVIEAKPRDLRLGLNFGVGIKQVFGS
jgi:hypothetical protein